MAFQHLNNLLRSENDLTVGRRYRKTPFLVQRLVSEVRRAAGNSENPLRMQYDYPLWELWSSLMPSERKNSASGPKKAVSPLPLACKYASAFCAIFQGSRVCFSMVIGLLMLQIELMAGYSMNRSTRAVSAPCTLEYPKGERRPASVRRTIQSKAILEHVPFESCYRHGK